MIRYFVYYVGHDLIREALKMGQPDLLPRLTKVRKRNPGIAWVRGPNGKLMVSHIIWPRGHSSTIWLRCNRTVGDLLTPPGIQDALQMEADRWTQRIGPDTVNGDEYTPIGPDAN